MTERHRFTLQILALVAGWWLALSMALAAPLPQCLRLQRRRQPSASIPLQPCTKS